MAEKMVYLDCNGTELRFGDLCRLSDSCKRRMSEDTESKILDERVLDSFRESLEKLRVLVVHLSLDGSILVCELDDAPMSGAMEPRDIEFVSRLIEE